MSKEWKAPDKVTQKMTRDGAVAENLTTGDVQYQRKAAGGKLFSPRRRGSGKGCAAYRRRD